MRAARFLIAVAIGYKVMSGLSWYAFASNLIARLPAPRKMTRAEEEAWFNRVGRPE